MLGLTPLSIVWALSVNGLGAPESARVDFNRDVRPILSDNCYRCHGPDEGERKAKLRFDKKDGFFAQRTAGVPVVPGKSVESLLYQRIGASNEADRMPPADSGKTLSAHEIDLIRRWIDQGAAWSGHWAFLPPRRPPLPAADSAGRDSEPTRNAIDHFLRARLDAVGLKPSPPADPVTLIRRVTLDLTGMPPSPAEVDAFAADAAANAYQAYERLVDRLLASPRYGEHMARYWLDVVRYGDTHGLHFDNERGLWLYRDWVIRSFNENKPFDAFTVEQLAGDLLPQPTVEQLVATGFNRCNVSTSEGGSIDDEVLMRYAVDRVEAVGTVWLGLTVGCAVCHDHKFDPISQKEFYQLFAFFNSFEENAMDGNALLPPPFQKVPSKADDERLAHLRTEGKALRLQLDGPIPDVDAAQEKWASELAERLRNASQVAETTGAVSSGDAALGAPSLGPWSLVGPIPAANGDEAFDKDFGPESKLDLGATFADGKLKWQERADLDDGKVHAFPDAIGAVYLHRLIRSPAPREFAIALGSDDGIKVWLNGKLVHENKVSRGAAPNQDKATLKLETGENRLLVKVANFGGAAGVYFQRGDADARKEALDFGPILAIAPELRSEADQKRLREYYRRNYSAEWKALEVKVTEQEKRANEFEAKVPGTMITREMAQRRDAFVLVRGQYGQKGEKVSPGVPAVFAPLAEGEPANRLGLARWLVRSDHPLTARVTVNRFWQQHFGAGIVKTAVDFGSQGEWPLHPELLDWLATEFVESGWDVKRFQKLIVLSAAYRQSTRVTPESLEKDPENRLLARGPRFRMDAEMIRDAALAVSGLLVERIGGRSVKPYQPGGIWEAVGFLGSDTSIYKKDDGDALYRRGLYTFWKRTAPPPVLSLFDAPTRETCTALRPRTNTPLQALALMNDPQFFEASRRLAERMMREGGASPEARIAYAFRLATARTPRSDELGVLLETFQSHLQEYQADGDAALKTIGVGDSKRDETLEPRELAAYTMAANLILNLDETLTKG